MSSASPPLDVAAPAATVILLRDAEHGLEVLLMQRARELAFHGGAWVFPGGRVDAVDHREADPVRVAMHAAVRETHEEAGVRLDVDALAPFAHWTTPLGRGRRFATWFFAAQLQADVEVVVDGSEMSAHRWLSPRTALALQAASELELPPPTFVTLSVLTRFGSAAQALAFTQTASPPIFLPRPRLVEAGIISLYPGDAAYEGAALDCVGSRHRLSMLQTGWRYEQPPSDGL